ncbi:MAG: IPT/TIG domain-containing protein [Acidobacteriota bacterium]|nr:IPT/TIG domain-containing protein [Acidobacteriota bacterium]
MLLRKLPRAVVSLGAAVAMIAAAACGGITPGGPSPTVITVTAVSPSTGSTFGGTPITITGTGFSSGATVLMGGTPALEVVVVNSTSITAKTPPHASGVGDVRVSFGSVNGNLASAFTFVTPTVGPNTPPTVSALTVQAPRKNQPRTLASIGDRMSLTVSVNDAETALSGLSVTWSALPNVGTFSGSGASVQWTAPASTSSLQTVILTVSVVESYVEADSVGLPVPRQHRIERSATVKVHDSVKEVSDMAVDFLTLFSNSALGPEAVLHNFSKTCDSGDGYGDEYGDVVYSRSNFVILSHAITPPTVFEYDFRSGQACTNKADTPGDACVEVPVTWTDRNLTTNAVNTVIGTDYVTGVYENAQWRLCHSRFTGVNAATGQPVIMDVTRRGIIKGPQQK